MKAMLILFFSLHLRYVYTIYSYIIQHAHRRIVTHAHFARICVYCASYCIVCLSNIHVSRRETNENFHAYNQQRTAAAVKPVHTRPQLCRERIQYTISSMHVYARVCVCERMSGWWWWSAAIAHAWHI